MSIIIQGILLLVTLAAMVMVLLGIRRLAKFDVYDDPKKTARLEQEVLEEEEVITRNSAFLPLLERQRYQTSTLSGPSSRKM